MTAQVSGDAWDDIAPARSAWIITLADLALLLVGFFVLLQANRELDRERLLAGLRAGFGIEEAAPPPMTVATARLVFATGSADADPRQVIAWARDAARDQRTRITVTGSTGPAGDADPATHSPAILAVDRARHVAAALIAAGVHPARISITVQPGRAPVVILSVGFAGDAS
ncbi:OmpA family protein [Sphingomonas turrisvirgatae]|uniref:Motility protein B-like N-terminal domain-containing protein n=1 Tax=Sphingomonas turrisvirgatae TaxID=1888892 RepID=A0A1E3M105_9SPHN|nr:OmpA family protein [Sphingomonas turrisvirgatae]ODP39045.1 hypothetical protein BFL28_11790 [Sphingomonas turrisvirgatae]